MAGVHNVLTTCLLFTGWIMVHLHILRSVLLGARAVWDRRPRFCMGCRATAFFSPEKIGSTNRRPHLDQWYSVMT